MSKRPPLGKLGLAGKRSRERQLLDREQRERNRRDLKKKLLSFERILDQHHRRRAGPGFVADWAMVLKLTMGSKSEFMSFILLQKSVLRLTKQCILSQ